MSDLIYQTNFDQNRFNSLVKTNYISSGLSKRDVFENVNRNVFYQMGGGDTETELRAGKLNSYKELLKNIKVQQNIKFLTAQELSTVIPAKSETLCQIRHDVDADIVACLPMAEIEAELGIKSTYYLLHTATYYGSWSRSSTKLEFRRNECLADHYLALQSLGHEVAIHTDPLHIYQNYNADGLEALREELSWLRKLGLKISGCAPHNNPTLYGASNSALFKGFPISELSPEHYKGVVLDGKWAPLSQVYLDELDLSYEADEVYLKGCPVDFISLTSEDKWWRMFREPKVYEKILEQMRQNSDYDAITHLIEAHPEIYHSKQDFELNDEQLVLEITHPSSKIVILSIHPEYYGWRPNDKSEPSIKPDAQLS